MQLGGIHMKRKLLNRFVSTIIAATLIMSNTVYAAPDIVSTTEKSTQKAPVSENENNKGKKDPAETNKANEELPQTNLSESDTEPETQDDESETMETYEESKTTIIFTDDIVAELDNGVLNITGTGKIPDYESGASPLWEYRREILTLQIGDGITHIGNQVFADCINIKDVKFPESLVEIGDYSFSYNVSLEEIKLPGKITTIGTGAFFSDIKLHITEFPESLKEIGDTAFYNCYSNNSIPNHDTVLGSDSFYVSKHRVTFIPDQEYNLTNGDTALFGNIYKAAADLSLYLNEESSKDVLNRLGLEHNRTFVSFEEYFDYLIELEQYGVKISYKLEILEIPENEPETESETSIESNTETENITEDILESQTATAIDTNNAEQIQFSEDIKGEYVNGILTLSGKGDLPNLTMGSENPINDFKSQIVSIIVEEGITSIGDFTFRNCTNVETLQLPHSLKTIGKYAFAENYCLSKVNLPENIEIIKEGAFSKDVNLQIENFPVSLKEIESYAFYNCFKTDNIDTAKKDIKINEDAFLQYLQYIKLDIKSYDKMDSNNNRNYIGSLFENSLQMSEELQDTTIKNILKKRGNFKDLQSYYDDIIKNDFKKINIKYEVSIADSNSSTKKNITPYAATTRNASTQAELETAISQSGSGDIINITKNMTIKNVVITNKNITIRASGGNRTITPADGNNVTAFIINGNSKVTFAATGTHTSSGSSVANKLHIGGSAKGTGKSINSSNIIVQGSARVNINANVLVRNSRYHTVYGDPNTTICLDGGTIMNSSGVTAVNNGDKTFGIGSYGTILIKDGSIYCASTNRNEQYGQGVHSNGGTITVSGGSIYNCNIGVGVNHGNGANGGNKDEAWATFKGGFIYNNNIGIQINNSLVDITSVYVGLSSYTNVNTFKTATNSTYGIYVSNKSTLWIETSGRFFHTGNAAIHNEGSLDITTLSNGDRPKVWGNATYGIRNTSTGYLDIWGVMIDGCKTGILNENTKKNNCIIDNTPYSTKGTLIQNCTVRGIQNNGYIEITAMDYGANNRVEIINNGSGDKGGGIYNSTGQTCIISGHGKDIDSIRLNSNKGNYGGGIYNDGTLKIDGYVSIAGNTTSASGGGIYNNSKLTVEGARILNNNAATYGGGVMNKDTFNFKSGEIGGNRATANSGGGICNDGGTQGVNTTLTITNGKIYGNTSNKGSGIEQHGAYNPKIIFKSGLIYGNIGDYGINNDAGSVELKDSAGMGYSAWTNSTTFTPSNNGIGNIYNKGSLYISGSAGSIWVCMASTTTNNINNLGICQISSAASGNPPVFTGSSSNAILNSGTLSIGNAMILGSQVGINNNNKLDIMGGQIYSCSAYGIYNNNQGTVNMSAVDIHDNRNSGTGAGVYNLGTYTMNSGNIRKNTSSGAGGVQNNGTFNLYGGNIMENQSGRMGGGVRNDGTFRMAGGSVTANTAASGGGGIFSGRDNELTISGGTISNNIATSGNGGGVLSDTNSKMTLRLTNTTITGNKAVNGSGGGVYYNANTYLESNNISGNSSATGGGILFGGTTNTMKSGSVSNNTATSFGGGIQVLAGKALTLGEVSIYGNTAPSDGGINNDGTVTMTGGTIHSNKCMSGNVGGGIRLGNVNASFKITGGRIYGNQGYGIVNALGTVSIENISSGNGWTLIGFESFQNAWNGLQQAQAESKQNSVGAIYNADRLNITGMSRIYSGSTYGIYNTGKLTLGNNANCAFFGNADFGIFNGNTGTMTMAASNQIWQAKTGLKNEGTATLSGGKIIENTQRGVENTGTFNLYSGDIKNNGEGISPGFFPSNQVIPKNIKGNGIYQNGTLNVKGEPSVSQDIFLTPSHFITVENTCSSKFITSMDEADTFEGRILANYKFLTNEQKSLYSLETKTKGYAESKGIVISDQSGVDSTYPYQVLLDGKRVLINYLPNGGTGKMEGDVVPLEAEYDLRENEFQYNKHSYAGWDTKANKQSYEKLYKPGETIVPGRNLKDDIVSKPKQLKNLRSTNIEENKISVKALVEEYGIPVARDSENVDYDYMVDLNAIWDEAPTIDTTVLEFYEGERVTKKQLMNEVYQSQKGATDYEDSMVQTGRPYSPHLLDDNVRIVGIEYLPILNGYKPTPSKISYPTNMPEDYLLNTYVNRGMSPDETVNHKLTFQVEDSKGNVTSKISDVRVLYNNFPTIKVPENLVMNTEELRSKPLSIDDLIKYAKANDVEDDAAKYQGLKDNDGNVINIQNKIKVENIQDARGNTISSGDIHDVGDYYITYSVTDRFGKETQKTMKLTSVEPAELTSDDIEYVRFITLNYLDTLDDNSKWDKEELRNILENESAVKTYAYTREEVLEIKELMKGLQSERDFKKAIKLIQEQYMDK